MDYMKNLDYNTLHLQNKDQVDQMKNLDCNQIKMFINLEIIGEEDKNKKKKKLYIYILENLTKFLQFDRAM